MATPPDDFSIASASGDGRTVLMVRGELDLATAPELEEHIDGVLDAGREVVVDLRDLAFMDSSGIRVLVAAHARAGRCGTRLIVVRPAPGSVVAKIIEISGLEGELNLVNDPASRV